MQGRTAPQDFRGDTLLELRHGPNLMTAIGTTHDRIIIHASDDREPILPATRTIQLDTHNNPQRNLASKAPKYSSLK